MPPVFLDTSYVIAFQAKKIKLITGRAVMLEIGNALTGVRYKPAAIKRLNALEAAPDVGIVGLAQSLYSQGFSLFRERRTKSGGLVDGISFVFMRERNIIDALTAARHFQQAGFRAVLRD